MVEFVDRRWVSNHVDDPIVVTIDSRSFMHYLKGHIRGAVNLPLARLFDSATLELLSDGSLAGLFGAVGVNRTNRVLLYDEYDGQAAATLAWVLEYLGHPNIAILSTFFEGWLKSGGEVMYKPVKPRARVFKPVQQGGIRAKLQEVNGNGNIRLLDVRSKDEFAGRGELDIRGGHIPGAINLPWTELLGVNYDLLRPVGALNRIVTGIGLSRSDKIVTYCRSGPRAALGYAALKRLGFDHVAVYDGSYLQWAKRTDLPVER